ncbi:MAG TPA: YfiR family protein [Holophagaceae bacterium]
MLFAGAVPVLVARPDFEYEYVLKAQILVELLPYVQWPPAPTPPTGPFIIGVYGRSPFGPSLDAYARTRTIQRRPIAIRYATRLEDLAGCDAVFISPSEASHADQVVAWARGRRVLTVADAGSALRQGVMVALLLEGDFVRLVVNLEVAQAQGLAFGSLLLRNARIVKSGSKLP